MLHKMSSSLGGRKVSPPTPIPMTEDQKASYLANLRNNRPARPTGSRPALFKSTTYSSLAGQTSITRSDTAPSLQSYEKPNEDPESEIKYTPNHGISKSVSFTSSIASKGRPLAKPHAGYVPSLKGRKVSPTASVRAEPNDDVYLGSTARRLEKEEAHTLREALHLIDQRDEEMKIYEAAQYEAADLVWKHRNPRAAEDEKITPYRNPDTDTENRKSYGPQLGNSKQDAPRSVSESSTASHNSNPGGTDRDSSRMRSRIKDRKLSDALKDLQLTSQERAAAILASKAASRRRSSGNRVTSNGSSKGIFRNPEDQIYEEPEGVNRETQTSMAISDAGPLRSRPRNSLPQGSRALPEKPNTAPLLDKPKVDRFEIHRNPPSQSRKADYTANTPPPASRIEVIEEVDTPKCSTATLEIRGEDIRAATIMKKKDRSPKLPTPTAVSDRPGRPIVSFDPHWRPRTESPRNSVDLERPVIKISDSPRSSKDIDRPRPRPLPSRTDMVGSAPAVPTISFPDVNVDIPTIHLEEESTPSLSVSASSLPIINMPTDPKPAARHLPTYSFPTPAKLPSAKTARLPWLQSGSRAMPTVSCSSCALPISGRIVTASASNTLSLKARFHPECFCCHHCSTALECVSFYAEPDNKRAERLEAEGILPDSPGAELRFYCHLDFHEFFSPRCRSCKTPIEGEVIVAAGGEYHVGHFFCGECGDPFDSGTPFVEKDGYAYCVSCHTKRTSARCKECKKQILDELTVEALSGKWHEECFVCFECGRGFGDDGRFFVRDIVVEPSEKERRKGITRKIEEKAVCACCEERRLKA